jgi:hypothetical protein
MESLNDLMNEYKKQITKGAITKAYRGLMEYIMDLRTHLKYQYPDYFISGIYYGYMDMTYFSFYPISIKERNLKIAIVFIHESCRFEAWLAGTNKQVQQKYWKLFKDSDWNKYHIVSTTEGVDSIVENVIADNIDFSDLDALTKQIEMATLKFIMDIEGFLAK